MRALSLLLPIIVSMSLALPVQAESKKDEFKTRITSALREKNGPKKQCALMALFYREGLDEKTRGILSRVVGRLAKSSRRNVAFAPLPEKKEFLHVLDGYEYRPNLEPIGYVVFTGPGDKPGNNTRIPYGLHPKTGYYAFPSTIRKLVNKNAEPDKQIQMIAIGIAHPPLAFKGWCDVALSNGAIKRITLEDQGVGNQTRIMRAQKIEGCKLINLSGQGSLSLKLIEGDETVFDERIVPPKTTLTYKR